jgi:cell division protein FtsZ
MAQVLHHNWHPDKMENHMDNNLFSSVLHPIPLPDPIEKELHFEQPVIKVVGLGGGGSNAVSRMMALDMSGVQFIAANTDYQALKNNPATIKIQLGPSLTRGLGAGGDPQIGRSAARESAREIAEALTGADMVFLTAGMGGGTGTGSIPVVAEIAAKLGIVVVAVVTMPFSFEMGRRQRNANEGLNQLRQFTNTLISIPNDRLLQVAPQNISLEVAFHLADDVLRQAVQGITELITEAGMINVDFSHIKRMMLMGGGAYMSIGQGQGEHKAKDAVDQALHHPLLEEISLDRAAGIIANFTGGTDLALYDVQEALSFLHDQSHANPDIIMGVSNDERMQGRVQVILVITGLGATTLEEAFNEISQPTKSITENIPLEPHTTWRELSEQNHLVTEMHSSSITNDLDVPAFIRKRARLAG